LTFPSRGGIGDEASKDRKGLTIVELGTSLGVTTAYLAAMDSRNKVVTYEGCPAVAEVARANWEKLGLNNIACVVGEITVYSLQFTVDSLSGIDVAFIDANHTCEATLTYFNALASRVHEKSVVVVDDIHYNEDMEKAWKAICADERVTTTMDLYRMGLVFFDKHYWRKHYKMRI
jgi:predicted O-methyltransferase YrrM